MAFLGGGGDHPSPGERQGGHVESGASLGGCASAGHVQVVLCGNCPAGTGLVRCYLLSKRERNIDGVEENIFMDVYGQTVSGGTTTGDGE